MILSMTGFGEASIEQNGHAYHLEIRSVNNRYLKASVKVPDDLAFLELEIEAVLRRRITRGSVYLRLYVRDLSAAAAHDINVAAIHHYLSQLRAAMPGESNYSIDLGTLAMLPGVCQPHEMTEREREQSLRIVEQLTDTALERLLDMRRKEGQALRADLLTHCERIRANLAAIRRRGGRVVDEYRQRLLSRVNELVAGSNVKLAEEDLIREVAVYADRSDISEELSRLDSHLDQLIESLDSPEPAGRKLEFIAQELLREANTIGSKAGDTEIARATIEIKSGIDRIKEQVQNVE